LKLENERLVLVLLAAMQFTTNLDFLIILPLGPQYMRVLHIHRGGNLRHRRGVLP
jgi:hypothetical protein